MAECRKCEEVVRSVERRSQESSFLFMDIAVTLLNNQPKRAKNTPIRKQYRIRKLEELLEKVTALRNSKGGILLVHITGLSEGDRFLGYFDEFVDEKLNKLIEDGKQFVDTYSRFWLSEKPGLSNYTDFVCLTVKASCSISTCDFKTKILLDSAIENPSTTNILSLLSGRRRLSEQAPTIRGSPSTLGQLNESRNIQLKAFKGKEVKQKDVLQHPQSLAEHIWESLRLREYITAYTKLEGGGSYFVGIEEIEEERDSPTGQYFTKTLDIHGVPVSKDSNPSLKSIFGRLIERDILVFSYDGQKLSTPPNLIEVEFHPISDVNNSDVVVIEVSVRQTTGLVFYDSEGPKSFRLHNQQLVPVPGKRWFQMIRKLADSFREAR